MKTSSPVLDAAKSFARAVCRVFPPARTLRTAYRSRQRVKYDALKHATPTEEKSIIFCAFNGDRYADSPRAIYEYLCTQPQFDDWTFYWDVKARALDELSHVSALSRATLVVRGSAECYEVMARSKYWIYNTRVPEYVYPKDDQVYVQCWHGTPLKRLGLDIPESAQGDATNTVAQRAELFVTDARKWTHLVSPCAFTSESLCSAFGVEKVRQRDIVLEVGYPRNDVLAQTLGAPDATERIDVLKRALGIPLDKKVLLYAPTWRDDTFATEGTGYTFALPLDLDAMREALGDEWVVLLRLHYYIVSVLDISAWEGFAFDVSRAEDINELYLVSDVLVTDYSSVFFDYANTGRPFIFFWPDYEHYACDLHGFYFDPHIVPAQQATTTAELIEAVRNNDTWVAQNADAVQAFREVFCPHDDGHAVQRVVERAIGAYEIGVNNGCLS